MTPSGTANWSVSEEVPLRVALTDPSPTSGSTGPTTWQLDIGPASGGVWWSTSGTLPPHEGGQRMDTIRTSWSTPADVQGAESQVLLRLTATVTDGEGQRAADFREALLSRPALTSGALWSLDSGPPAQSAALGTATPGPWPLDMQAPEHLLFLDGQDLVLIGGMSLEAISTVSGSPGPLLWTRASPSGLVGDHVRALRRTAPTGGPAQAWVGWGDRVERIGAESTPVATWLLQEGEVLLDVAEMADALVALVRTAQGEWRMVKFNVDNSARVGSITWTPEAPGSVGPEGQGWLLALDGAPAALEADGRARRWFTEADGNTGLSTLTLNGAGAVSHAGILEDGRSWVSRDQSHVHAEGQVGQLFDALPVRVMTTDRAADVIWRLTDNAGNVAWHAMDRLTLSPLALPPLDVPSTTTSGCVAHNRPGPP